MFKAITLIQLCMEYHDKYEFCLTNVCFYDMVDGVKFKSAIFMPSLNRHAYIIVKYARHKRVKLDDQAKGCTNAQQT